VSHRDFRDDPILTALISIEDQMPAFLIVSGVCAVPIDLKTRCALSRSKRMNYLGGSVYDARKPRELGADIMDVLMACKGFHRSLSACLNATAIGSSPALEPLKQRSVSAAERQQGAPTAVINA